MKNGKKGDKRAISPVIATVLLIAMVIVIALIVFLWFRGMTGDYGEKFGKNVELACQDVQLEADYYQGTLYVVNDGNVPVYKMNVKLSGAGSHSTEDLSTLATDWPESGLNSGSSFSGSVDIENAEEITLIPVLLATSEKGNKKTFECSEIYGYEISVI